MNFKKLQAMQLELDNSILSAKPQMTAEERFNKTLVALSVEVSEVANCAEHFKFWKDNKGKVDGDKFEMTGILIGGKPVYFDNVNKQEVKRNQAHKLTLVEEASDCLHFILSLANQIGYEIDGHYNELEETETIESVFLNLVFQITLLQRYGVVYSKADEVTLQCVINNYFQYIGKLGITTQELEQAYYEKNEENYRRLREGY
ncbi:dUTP diphosphatase [Vagococcus fluvialis]|uniref:dUTP diphosphatase n=1 Tax=Vagococcus fluvialis TaxID=2738 RepID=UPI003789306D